MSTTGCPMNLHITDSDVLVSTSLRTCFRVVPHAPVPASTCSPGLLLVLAGCTSQHGHHAARQPSCRHPLDSAGADGPGVVITPGLQGTSPGNLSPALPRSEHRSCRRGGLGGPLVPSVEGREVASRPGRAEPRGAQIPVLADLAHRRAQVPPQVAERGAPPEPVAVVDAVNDQPRLEYERVRDHRVME